MKSYETKIGGYRIRQQFSDEEAERRGLKPSSKKAEPVKAEPVETAAVEPENKGRGRGRTIKRG